MKDLCHQCCVMFLLGVEGRGKRQEEKKQKKPKHKRMRKHRFLPLRIS